MTNRREAQITVPVMAQRDAFGEALVNLATEFRNMLVLSPDVSLSTRSVDFKASYPQRFFCTGIAEQNTLGLAAGLTDWGYIPVVAMYAIFAASKAADQVINSIAYPNLNVKIVGTHGGINVGPDGPTHQAIADLAVMRSIPNVVVLTAADASEVEPALRAALTRQGPVYLRLERAPTPILNLADHPYRIGHGIVVRGGSDVSIIAIGSMVWAGLQAAEQLARHNVSARVINIRSLKPIDENLILVAASETCGIVTAEDHNRYGGLRSAVAEVLAAGAAAPMRYVALEDCFAGSGTCNALRSKYRLTTAHIVDAALELCGAARRAEQP